MDILIGKLEEFGLKNFINAHQHELSENTVNQLQIASFLKFDADQIATIMEPPDNLARCAKLYEFIQKTTAASHFLQSLEKTNNDFVLKFIQLILLDSCSGSGQNPSINSGIWFNIPESIESFCGREDFLVQLHEKLLLANAGSTTEVTVLSQVNIISGLGGIGKTETATQYIMKYRQFYNNFIWIKAESDDSMRNSFIKLAKELEIPVKNSNGKSREIEEIVNEIYRKICKSGKTNLIIFDNAEDYQRCKNFFLFGLDPDFKKPVILVTSRKQEWKSDAGKMQVLPLDSLTDDESLKFILKQLEIEDSPEFREESKEFIELIGGLPLALQQAVAFIKREKELRKYLGKSYKIQDFVLEFKFSMNKFLSFSPVSGSDSSATVFVTWNVTFQKILGFEGGEEAAKILEFLSFLYADKIPLSFLRDLVPEIGDEEFAEALKLLEKYSLIKINFVNFYLSLHRQLQFVILLYLQECEDFEKVAMKILDKCKVVLKNIKLSESSDIFLSVHQIVNNKFDLIPVTKKFLDFMYKFGTVLWRASRYSESLDLSQKVYSKRRELLGENHQNTLNSQHHVALQLLQLGRYEESLALHQENLKSKEIHLGPDLPNTISTKNNIAFVLLEQKKYKESLELYQQVLAQRNKIQGKNHPDTLNTLNSIALVHGELGDLSKALDLFQDLEKKQMEILGADHEDVLHTKHNKAGVLYKMGKYEESSKIFNEVYEKNKEILGENHLDTINTLDWIAATLEKEGKFREALQLCKKVYEIRKENLGENQQCTIISKNCIVNLENKLWWKKNRCNIN